MAASPFDRFGIIPPPTDDFAAWRLPFALRDYQDEAVEAALAKHYGTIELPTASGKTLAAIALIIRLRQPTLILVPTKALIDQVWIPALASPVRLVSSACISFMVSFAFPSALA